MGCSQQTGQQAESTSDRRFNLEKTKATLFAQIEDGCSLRFKTFFKSYQFDRFLHTAILYFISYFQLQALQRLGKGSRSEVAALKREMAFQLSELAPVYATIIMSESDYENTHQDKKFFEGFYETTTEILLQAFPGTRRQVMLEEELGRVLRTDQFNTPANKRRSKDHISQSALTIRELYSLKHEGDPSLASRQLADLYQKNVNQGNLTLASVSNTPLVGQVISPEEDAYDSYVDNRVVSPRVTSRPPKSEVRGGAARLAEGVANGKRPFSRMPWLQRRPSKEEYRPTTASQKARDGFVNFKRANASPTASQQEETQKGQRHLFDEGVHRAGMSSRNTGISSRGSSATSSRLPSSRYPTSLYTDHSQTDVHIPDRVHTAAPVAERHGHVHSALNQTM